MSEIISRFAVLPAYGIGALVVILLFAIQSEIRFGARARTMRAGASDRNSTLTLSLSAAVPLFGFALAMKANSSAMVSVIPNWFRIAVLPGLPGLGWLGVVLGGSGLALRLWALLTLRERFTRTLVVQEHQSIERSGPYRWIRHPGYLGSLLCLNGVALASGNLITLLASLAATSAGYGYRIKIEDEMLVAALGPCYAEYRNQVRALIPTFRAPTANGRLSLPMIREASTATDIAIARELFEEYQRTLDVDLCFQGFTEELASLPGAYARPTGRLLLVSNDSLVLGVVALRSLGEDCEMKRLYVRPEGRGLGVGRLLATRLIDEARLAGYRRMLLDTLPMMKGAQALYRSMGFTEIAAYCNNPIAGTLYMALEL